MNTKLSIRSILIPLIIFGCVFGIIVLLLNLPATAKTVSYTVTHSEEKDNQQLTDQYRSLYGYANHPEINQLPVANGYTGTTTQGDITAGMELSVPKLAIKASVQAPASAADADIMASLKKGVVLYPGSAMPGTSGTTVIVGHSSSLPPWTEYSAIFAKLGALQANDLVYLTYGGQEHIYRVTTVRRGSVQDILNSGMTGDLILSSCWPVGTDTNRVAVAAVRVQ